MIMDAEWWREKLPVLLEKVDRDRVNGLVCDFYDINIATNIRRRGTNHRYGKKLVLHLKIILLYPSYMTNHGPV